MCGIFGIVTRADQVLGPLLIEAGRRLSYRGYDSVGCATMDSKGMIDLRKDIGKIDEVARRLNFAEMSGDRGILQLRWATFGHPSMENAQPHMDSDGDMVGAHNGNVVNNVELRKQFIDEGLVVRSTNDGESCVHAVERYVNQGKDMLSAIRLAYRDLEGDYAFVIGKVNEKRLYAVKKGSGLVAGIADGAICVSSDLPSILPLTRQILRIHDGEVVIFSDSEIELRQVEDGSLIERPIEIVNDSIESTQKGGYPHFMLKEIHEQVELSGELLHLLDKNNDIDLMVQRLKSARHVYLVGCGTSFNACILGSLFFNRLAGIPAVPVLATQFVAQYAPGVSPDDVGIFVSQSGETKDVLNAVDASQRRNMSVLGMVNVIGSTLMRVSDYCFTVACGYEISVPATKTYFNQALSFLYLALRIADQPTDLLSTVPALVAETIRTTEPQMLELMPLLDGWNDLYCLGYGLTYPVALEGALKFKEVTYAHCEGILSTEFKHGPLSAVSQDYPVFFVAGVKDIPLIISGINEVTCRGGRALVIGEDDARLRANASKLILLPQAPTPEINALISVLPMQLLSYHLSAARGIDPDFPRNLSKTLTVD